MTSESLSERDFRGPLRFPMALRLPVKLRNVRHLRGETFLRYARVRSLLDLGSHDLRRNGRPSEVAEQSLRDAQEAYRALSTDLLTMRIQQRKRS